MPLRRYYMHQFLTFPDKKGMSRFGVSQYALRFFVRFQKITIEDFPKTIFSIKNKLLIDQFLKLNNHRYLNQLLKSKGEYPEKREGDKNILSVSQKMQFQRFVIRKGEAFASLHTLEYDIELTAPVDLRVLELNYDVFYDERIITAPYLFEVQCLREGQFDELMNEEEYIKAPKFFNYV